MWEFYVTFGWGCTSPFRIDMHCGCCLGLTAPAQRIDSISGQQAFAQLHQLCLPTLIDRHFRQSSSSHPRVLLLLCCLHGTYSEATVGSECSGMIVWTCLCIWGTILSSIVSARLKIRQLCFGSLQLNHAILRLRKHCFSVAVPAFGNGVSAENHVPL